jgi:hypothetical protein
VADSLKVRVASCIEAEHICDLDVDDPVRDVVLETEIEWDSAISTFLPGANRLWVKNVTIPVAAPRRYTFNLFDGTFGPTGGAMANMLDGFGQHVTFEEVYHLEITGIETNPSIGYLYLRKAGANPLSELLDNFAAGAGIRLNSRGQLRFSSGDRLGYASFAGEQSFDVENTAIADMTVTITIVGYQS